MRLPDSRVTVDDGAGEMRSDFLTNRLPVKEAAVCPTGSALPGGGRLSESFKDRAAAGNAQQLNHDRQSTLISRLAQLSCRSFARQPTLP
jgi:hypothetical protein